jgi:hypothetical protein
MLSLTLLTLLIDIKTDQLSKSVDTMKVYCFNYLLKQVPTLATFEFHRVLVRLRCKTIYLQL